MKIVSKPIDIIASFDKEGNPSPIKFRITKDDETLTTVVIDRVKSKNMEKLGGGKMMVFKCQSFINNSIIPYELKYDLETCKWILFKI